jgi:hypothetical protein
VSEVARGVKGVDNQTIGRFTLWSRSQNEGGGRVPQPEPWRKSLIQFQPSGLFPRERSERHYLEVHSPWALREIRRMDDMVAYHTNLVLGQWDLLGGFHQAPDLWRFATMRTRPGGSKGFPAGVLGFLSADHQNFARDLRGFQVEESV